MYKSVLIGLIDILYDKDEFYSCKISTQMSNDNYDDNSILLTLKSFSLPIFFYQSLLSIHSLFFTCLPTLWCPIFICTTHVVWQI